MNHDSDEEQLMPRLFINKQRTNAAFEVIMSGGLTGCFTIIATTAGTTL